MRPIIAFRYDGQIERARCIPQEIVGLKPIKPDIVTFNEVFEKRSFKHLTTQMKKEGYCYHTPVLAAHSSKMGSIAASLVKYAFTKKGRKKYPTLGNGGVVIFSKWPIKKIDEIPFGKNLSAGFDALADKGCMYAQIEKRGMTYHVFATHTDATDEDVREKQLEVFKKFIDTQQISQEEPVIIAGDMNICKEDPDSKLLYEKMLTILNVKLPTCKGYKYTFARGGRNILCDHQELPSLYLDYIFFEKSHLCPKVSYNEVLTPRLTYKPWNNRADHPYYKGRWEYSDHYPIYGYFNFER